MDVPLEDGAEPLRVPGSSLPPLPLDPGARLELSSALTGQMTALANELGIAALAV
jgi:hypothetical protein